MTVGGGPFQSGWRWLQRYALGVPIVLGVAMVLTLALFFALGSGFRDPERVDVGEVDDYEIGKPIYFEVDKFWVVRLSEDDFLAMYDKDPHSGCEALWYVNEEFMGTKGWFTEPCLSMHYDYAGNCFGDDCRRGLDRFPISVEDDGRILMDISKLAAGPEYDAGATPLVPPSGD